MKITITRGKFHTTYEAVPVGDGLYQARASGFILGLDAPDGADVSFDGEKEGIPPFFLAPTVAWMLNGLKTDLESNHLGNYMDASLPITITVENDEPQGGTDG